MTYQTRILTTFILLLLLLGCYKKTENFTQKLKLISLSPNVTEIIGTYGDPTMLKGRTLSCNYPKWVKDVPKVISLKPNYEMLLFIHPDLIVYDPNLFNPLDISKLKEIGSKLLPIKAASLHEFICSLTLLDRATNYQLNLTPYIEKIKKTIAKAIKKSTYYSPKVAILLDIGDQKQYWIAGEKMFQTDILKKLGASIIGPNTDHFQKLNLEYLVSCNPDIIFIKDSIEDFLRDPRLKTISAIKNKNIFNIEPDILLRAGARVDQLIKGFNFCLERCKRRNKK